MSTLAQKQRILGRLDEVKRRYPELSRQWTSLRDAGLPAVRNDCESLIAETESILAELLESEKQGTQQLSQRRESTRRQLEAVSQGVHVNQTYADTTPTFNHRFLNTNG
jgi:chromosome segregation ATPase